MSEHLSPPEDPDPYWQEDLAIGEGRFERGQTRAIRLRLHTETERYHAHQEILPLTQPRGERVYVHGKPYIVVPDFTVTLGLYQTPSPDGTIGAVTGSEWRGMRHEEIGQCQAWVYPADRLVLLWECFADDRFRAADPRIDPVLAMLWTGFERFLTTRFSDATHLATTWEPIYERAAWQAFLEDHGYRRFTSATFVKAVLPR
jgi:hypothetical protein